MTTWQGLVNYVRSRYAVADEQPGMMRLVFNYDDGRSQLVVVSRLTLENGEEWADIHSAFGELESIDLGKAVRYVGEKAICGGISSSGDFATFRHAAPLLKLDPNEFDRPLLIVAEVADELERELTGNGDLF